MPKWILSVLALLLASTLSAQDASSTAAAQVLQPGDVVRITVWRRPEISGEFTVSAEGTVKHPLYQDVNVVGVPLATARQRIADYIARIEQNAQFVFEPLYRVVVAGEVRLPNVYPLPRETTVLQALGAAGGFTTTARVDRVALIRDGRTLQIDLNDPTDAVARSPIHSGDQILVPRRRDLLREYIAPIAGIIAAVAATINIFTR